jgi:hypothetical protein
VGRWRAAEIPVLQIRFETESVAISPVLTGKHGCLNCELQRFQDIDSDYTAIATQLLESQLRFDDAAGRLMAAGFAVQNILEYLDGRSLEQVGYQISRTGRHEVESILWSEHPACSCQISEPARFAEAV